MSITVKVYNKVNIQLLSAFCDINANNKEITFAFVKNIGKNQMLYENKHIKIIVIKRGVQELYKVDIYGEMYDIKSLYEFSKTFCYYYCRFESTKSWFESFLREDTDITINYNTLCNCEQKERFYDMINSKGRYKSVIFCGFNGKKLDMLENFCFEAESVKIVSQKHIIDRLNIVGIKKYDGPLAKHIDRSCMIYSSFGNYSLLKNNLHLYKSLIFASIVITENKFLDLMPDLADEMFRETNIKLISSSGTLYTAPGMEEYKNMSTKKIFKNIDSLVRGRSTKSARNIV